MNHQAVRRYSQQDCAASGIVRRRDFAPYENRVRKAPYKGSRNLVWTSEGNNRPRKNDEAYGSRKNYAYGSRVWRSSGVANVSPKCKGCVCKFWKAGNCKKGEQCRFLHSWSSFPGLVTVATLEGHNKELKGIALPQGSDKLFSVSSDGSLRIWDCNSGKCVQETTNLEAEAGALISEGPWVFLGLPNAVKAFNVQTCKEAHLNNNGRVQGLVNAIAVGNRMIFAGTSSGVISVWKIANDDADTNPFEYLTCLEGHSGEVKCLIVGANTLYSGSTDKTIKAWDLNTLQCTMTLKHHTNTVTSLLCWDQYLLSSSLDRTVLVWGYSQEENNGSLKVIHTRKQDESVHLLCGVHDAEAKPIIFCSYRNGDVGIYDLPSFEERGKMYATQTIETITIGPDGLFFSGDKSGQVRVWSLNGGGNNKV